MGGLEDIGMWIWSFAFKSVMATTRPQLSLFVSNDHHKSSTSLRLPPGFTTMDLEAGVLLPPTCLPYCSHVPTFRWTDVWISQMSLHWTGDPLFHYNYPTCWCWFCHDVAVHVDMLFLMKRFKKFWLCILIYIVLEITLSRKIWTNKI